MAIAALLVDFPLFRVRRHEVARVRTTLSVCFALAIVLIWGAAPAIVVQAVAALVSAAGQRYAALGVVLHPARLVWAVAASALALHGMYGLYGLSGFLPLSLGFWGLVGRTAESSPLLAPAPGLSESLFSALPVGGKLADRN